MKITVAVCHIKFLKITNVGFAEMQSGLQSRESMKIGENTDCLL